MMRRMRGRRLSSLAIAATLLVAWHGLLIRLPHTHLDDQVPRYEGTCSAARPGSHAFHLHRTPVQLAPHQCLACLVSSTSAAPTGESAVPTPQTATGHASSLLESPPAIERAHLPDLRAPPILS